jgi:polyhydroxyalkanoate synthesis regulator phasin
MGDTVGDMKKVIATVSIITALGAGAFLLNTVLPAGASSSSVFQMASSTDSTASGAPSTDPNGPKCMGPRAKFKDVLDGLVSDGTINQDQEDKIIQAFKDAKPEKAQGQGQGQGPLGRRGRGAAPGQILKGMVGVAADTIGVQPSDLANELRSGKSVADVATAHNVDPQTVVQAIVDAGNKKVDEAVTNGKLTPAQGDKIKSRLSDAATKFVNHTRPNC